MNQLNEFIELCKDYSPKAIGISLPGHFDKTNNSIITNNPFWKTFNIKILLDNINMPIYFENNVKKWKQS